MGDRGNELVFGGTVFEVVWFWGLLGLLELGEIVLKKRFVTSETRFFEKTWFLRYRE
jgi:hypothetical protein